MNKEVAEEGVGEEERARGGGETTHESNSAFSASRPKLSPSLPALENGARALSLSQ